MNANRAVGLMAFLVGSDLAAQPDSLLQKIRAWEGQRVTVSASKASYMHHTCTPNARPNPDTPSYAAFDGRSGVVARLEFPGVRGGPLFRLAVAMDGGDTLRLCDELPLKFHAELDSARKLVGKAVWTKGPRVFNDTSGKSFQIDGAERLVIIGADWGEDDNLIELTFRGPRGSVGRLQDQNTRQGFAGGLDDRFRRKRLGGWDPMLAQFFFSDPRAAHRDWPAAMWQKIRSGEVVVGMTLEMAEMACGTGMRVVGATVGGAGGAGRIYKCDLSDVFFKKFVVVNGKVTQVTED